ncbi:BTB/POZ domain-containing protein 17-like isoform X1 [Asterias amurensis]|uniref:BTB/POZ domain-containing protein 17-like isoform X1 n=2 Tax=Asterias amurensis TaxID=7602 RepID=UPI003AB43B6E
MMDRNNFEMDYDYEEGILNALSDETRRERAKNKENFDRQLRRTRCLKEGLQKRHEMRMRITELHPPVLLVQCLSTLFDNPRLSDVTLKVGTRSYHAHSLILGTWSEIFKTMLFDEKWAPKPSGDSVRTQTLNEPEDCADCFEHFLKFMYTEELELTKETVHPMLLLADKYMVSDLHEICEAYLMQVLESTTTPWVDAVQAMTTATEGLTRIQEKCYSLMENNFYAIRESNNLGPDVFLALLGRSGLVVPSEKFVLRRAIAWLSKNRVELEGLIKQVLSLIRYEHIPARDLEKLSFLEQSLILQPMLKECVFEAFKYRAFAGEGSYTSMARFSDPRVYMEPEFCVRISNPVCQHQVESSPFRRLTLEKEEEDKEFEQFEKFKLFCPVARQGEQGNVYLINEDMWKVGGRAVKEDDAARWSIKFRVLPHFEDIGRSFVMALLVSKDQTYSDCISSVAKGDVGKKLELDVPWEDLDCSPQHLWIKVAIFISGCDKSWVKK